VKAFTRRRLWIPLLVLLFAAIGCVAVLFRRIGLGELAVILAPLALIVVIESGRYIVRQLAKGYRGPGDELNNKTES